MTRRTREPALPPELRDVEPMEPDPSLRRRVLASLESDSRFEGFAGRFARLFDLPEARARELLRTAEAPEAGGWVDAPVPGVRLLHFPGGERVATADCGFVRLAPGSVFPAHRHRGAEWTLVLAGRAEEDGGEIWLPGDLVVREGGSIHGFRCVGDEPYLFAVVLHGGIEAVGD